MNNLNINPQFIGSQQTHRTIGLHRIDQSEDVMTIVLKIIRERLPSRYLLWTRRSVVNYSHIIMRAARLMKRPSVIDPPSGRVPERSTRWPHDGTETCGGGERVSGLPPGFLGY